LQYRPQRPRRPSRRHRRYHARRYRWPSAVDRRHPAPRRAPKIFRARRTAGSTLRARVARRDLSPGRAGVEQTREDGLQIADRHADLFHRVALPDGDLTVPGFAFVGITDGFHVNGYAVGRADLVLTPIQASDGRGVVIEREPSPRQPPAQIVARR